MNRIKTHSWMLSALAVVVGARRRPTVRVLTILTTDTA